MVMIAKLFYVFLIKFANDLVSDSNSICVQFKNVFQNEIISLITLFLRNKNHKSSQTGN